MNATDQRPVPPLTGDNWQLRLTLADLEATEILAQKLAAQLRSGDLLVLTGGLGAGKTTFTQSLGEAMDVEGRISSPTFVLSRVHPSRSQRDGGEAIDLVHVDAYRTDAEGLESLDLLSTMEDSVTVVEWGRGLVEHALVGSRGSWLDLQLVDPEPAGQHRGIITDFSESEADLLGAPRFAVLRGYGPRWSAPPEALNR